MGGNLLPTAGPIHELQGGAATLKKILEVKNLRTCFHTPEGLVPAVDGVSFSISEGETLCIVGESGCGKSVTSMSIMKLLQTPPAEYQSGEILFDGVDLLQLSQSEMAKYRGNRISMIFQEPMTALNPVYRVGHQIGEVLRLHKGQSKKTAFCNSIELLKIVGVPDPQRCANSFPHQLSGGMRQRVMIAMAIACSPELLIADEPTTALDVTVQAQILDLLARMKKETGMTMMFITHDLGVVAEIATRVLVMYAGRIVEEAPCSQLFQDPKHPYTKGLMHCIPRVDELRNELEVIRGQVPNLLNLPKGCRFAPRCPYCTDLCREQEPELKSVNGHGVACHLAGQLT